MKSGLIILFVIPVAVLLVALNCTGWELVHLRTGGLVVEMGLGWPWSYYTYPVNRVGIAEWHLSALALDMAVALGILGVSAGLVFLLSRGKKENAWR